MSINSCIFGESQTDLVLKLNFVHGAIEDWKNALLDKKLKHTKIGIKIQRKKVKIFKWCLKR